MIPISTALCGCLLLPIGCGTPSDPALEAAKEAGREACDRYIDCALDVAPETVAGQLSTYGPDGSCWDSDDAKAVDICTTACTKSRDGLGEIFPKSASCGECETDAHCVDDDAAPRCDVKRHWCVECLDDVDCDAGVCDPESRACVECLASGDCDGKACDVETMTCVGCLGDADCSDGVCDEDRQLCVGCLAGTDCAEGFCDYQANVCVECLYDLNCTGGKTCVDFHCA